GQHAERIDAGHVLAEQRKGRSRPIDRAHAPGEILELARAADERGGLADDGLTRRVVSEVETLDLVLLEARAADDREPLADLDAILGVDRPGFGAGAIARLQAVAFVEPAWIEVLRIDRIGRGRKAVVRVFELEHV